MEVVARINQAKYDVFRWRYGLSIPKKLTLAFGMACLVGLLAQVRIVVPWSPVPVTGQTFAVLLAAVLLGRWWGGISIATYVGLGVLGVPWFTGFNSGLTYLAGPTGGYIIGFILAAFFLGHLTDKYVRARSFFSMTGLMLFANFILVFIPGLIQLGLWLRLVGGETVTLAALLSMGLLPFIAGDVVKVILAAVITRGVTPKAAFNGETDEGKWAGWRVP
ncbi:MAG: biotin transporter BioY [Dehalococcoidales bacterium]|nr:MAG: biotin transporter BioY [Dehalococcoidales bacterium]